MIWSQKETLDREQIREIQLKRLKKTVKYAYKHVPTYQEKFKAAGVHPDDIQSLEDIKKLPLHHQGGFRKNYPFGMFAVPSKDIIRYHASSGTTGNPTVVGYTRHDMKVWKECMARLVTMAGVSDRDTAQISFGYGLFTGCPGGTPPGPGKGRCRRGPHVKPAISKKQIKI